MEIDVIQREGEPVIIHARGEITVKSYRTITDTVEQVAALEPVPDTVYLDLTEVSYVDSVGLGAFLKMFHTLKKKSADLILRGVTEDVRESLAITKLDKLLRFE